MSFIRTILEHYYIYIKIENECQNNILAITIQASGGHLTGCVTADNICPENNVYRIEWFELPRLTSIKIIVIVVGHAKVVKQTGRYAFQQNHT